MSIYGRFQGRGPNGFGYETTSDEVSTGLDLSGRTILVTGAASGLGGDMLRVLSLRGATVIASARTLDAARTTCAMVPSAVPIGCDLSEPASVRAAVAKVRDLGRLDAIVANAGVMALPTRTVKHGLELQLLTNHFGHFLLVTGLLDRLTERGRVVILSSAAHTRAYDEGVRLDDLAAERGYDPWGAYGQAKLANLLFAKHLATRLPAGQTANSVHPGVIATNLSRHMPRVAQVLMKSVGPVVALKSIPQGSATQTFVAVHPGAAATTGEYWADCNPARTSRHGHDAELARRLWERTEEVCATLG